MSPGGNKLRLPERIQIVDPMRLARIGIPDLSVHGISLIENPNDGSRCEAHQPGSFVSASKVTST
jgi:hypothetical protein